MIITVDVGGTKTLVASFSADGNKLDSYKFPTPKDQTEFINELNKAISNIKTADSSCISIAMPGLIDRKNGVAIKFGNLTWENLAIRDLLSKEHDLPVLVDNDANLAGLAEANELDIDKYPLVIYVTVSTGIGTGIIDRHKIHPELADSEGGAMHFMHEGKLQQWEHFASGSAIKARTGKLASEINDSKVWREITSDLSQGFINMIALIQPDAIVIGGGVGSHFEKFEKYLKQDIKIAKENSSTIRRTDPLVIKAQHPEEAVIYGCYILAKQEGYAAT